MVFHTLANGIKAMLDKKENDRKNIQKVQGKIKKKYTKKRKSEKRYILCPILSKILFSGYGIILERLNVKKYV